MTPYSSKNGKGSGIVAYEIGPDYIIVQTHGYRYYRYSYRSAGKENVESMKKCALESKGLSSYISRHRPGFE
jgi:hypothetical protein